MRYCIVINDEKQKRKHHSNLSFNLYFNFLPYQPFGGSLYITVHLMKLQLL